MSKRNTEAHELGGPGIKTTWFVAAARVQYDEGEEALVWRVYETLEAAKKFGTRYFRGEIGWAQFEKCTPALLALDVTRLKPAEMTLEEEYAWHEKEMLRHARIADELQRRLLGKEAA